MRRYAKRKKTTPKREVKELSDKDLHCCARIFQSIMFAPKKFDKNGISHDCNPFYACKYCKYVHSCMENDVLFDGTRQRLQALTGVDLSITYDKNDPEKTFRHYLRLA